MGYELEVYTGTSTETITVNGVEFTLLHYTGTSEGNPYSRGVTAFGRVQNHAINAELTFQADFQGELKDILTGFLNGIHYAE